MLALIKSLLGISSYPERLNQCYVCRKPLKAAKRHPVGQFISEELRFRHDQCQKEEEV